jgi:hypothetical protein
MGSFAKRHLNKRIVNRRNRGQGLVEFAMISLLLFMLLIGVMEMGRMMFIWTQLTSAAQEGARYGLTHPIEITSPGDPSYPCTASNLDPCNIISQARARLVLVPTDTVAVEVGYENGSGQRIDPWTGYSGCSDYPTFSVGSDRVVVTTTYQFHFLVGIMDNFAPNGLRMQMVAARTVMNDEERPPVVQCSYDPSAPPTPTP